MPPVPRTFIRAARRPARLSLGDLLHLHGAASPAVLLLVLALGCALPAAGVGTALSLAILVLAWRWPRVCDDLGGPPAVGGRLAGWRLDETWSRRCLRLLAWLYAVASRLLRERWAWACRPRTRIGWAAWIALMGVLILLPIPLGNLLPALSLVLLSLGWMFRDGLALALSALAGAAALAFAWSAAGLVLQLGQALLARLG